MQAFGPVKNNKFLRGTPLQAIMRIWMDNRKSMTQSKMINLFKLRLVNDAAADQIGSLSGRTSCVYARNQYLMMLNLNRARDVFVNGDTIETAEEF